MAWTHRQVRRHFFYGYTFTIRTDRLTPQRRLIVNMLGDLMKVRSLTRIGNWAVFLQQWQNAHLRTRPCLLALSDHGESLGEHGEFSHGVFLYDSTLRIPWLMVAPGLPAGKKVTEQVRTIDLLPTVLSLLDGEIPASSQGVDLLPATQGKSIGTVMSYGETLYPKTNMGWAELRSMRTSRWKYIRAPKSELYDLQNDPQELKNLIQKYTKEASQLEEGPVSAYGNG